MKLWSGNIGLVDESMGQIANLSCGEKLGILGLGQNIWPGNSARLNEQCFGSKNRESDHSTAGCMV